MNVATVIPAPLVKGNLKIDQPAKEYGDGESWIKRDLRARRALQKSTVPVEARAMFEYLVTLQGRKEFAFPTRRMLQASFGASHAKVERWIKLTEEHLKPVFEVVRAEKIGSGRKRNLYKCVEYCKWSDDFILKLRATAQRYGKPNPVQDDYYKRLLAAYNLSVPKIGTQDSENGIKSVHYLGGIEDGSFNTQTNPENTTLCSICNNPLRGSGFHFKGHLLCERDGPCHQESHDTFEDLPF